MKSITAYFKLDSDMDSNGIIDKLLKLLTKSNNVLIRLNFDLSKTNNKDELCNIVRYITKKINEYSYKFNKIFKLAISIQLYQFCGLLYRLTKKNNVDIICHIPIDLKDKQIKKYTSRMVNKKACRIKIDEIPLKDFITTYDILKKYKLPIVFEDINDNVADLKEIYKYWIHDTDGIEVSFFSDITSAILRNTHSNLCTHNSCLGNCIAVDCNGGLAYCPKNFEDTYVDNIDNISDIDDFFNSDTFSSILVESIHKRDMCKKQCKHFRICLGGCPLNKNKCDYIYYLNFYNTSADLVKKIAYTADYKKINPAVKTIIYKSLSYGHLSDLSLITNAN